jgi:probable phosphoglycerate mutase
MSDFAKDGVDPLATEDAGVHGELQRRRVLHTHLAAEGTPQSGSGRLEGLLGRIGRRQVEALARQLAVLSVPVDVVVTSDLQRTRATASIIADALGGLPVVVQAAWAERRLGEWNLRLIDETHEALLAGHTPPGGESNADFTRRIAAAARGLGPLLARRPLLVGSKGVARVMGELCGLPDRVDMDNGEMCRFDLSAVLHREPAWETS